MTESVNLIRGRIKERIKTGEEDIKQNWENTKDELIETLLAWEAKSHDFVRDFTKLFGADGPMRKIFKISPKKRNVEESEEISINATCLEEIEDGHRSPFEGLLPEGLKRRFMSVLGKEL